MQNLETKAVPHLRRKVEINNREYVVFGRAPWVTTEVEKTDKNPACTIIIEASMIANSYHRKLMYNALSTRASNGAMVGVVFVSDDGKARASEICKRLNFQLG